MKGSDGYTGIRYRDKFREILKNILQLAKLEILQYRECKDILIFSLIFLHLLTRGPQWPSGLAGLVSNHSLFGFASRK